MHDLVVFSYIVERDASFRLFFSFMTSAAKMVVFTKLQTSFMSIILIEVQYIPSIYSLHILLIITLSGIPSPCRDHTFRRSGTREVRAR
jgi:hypothetical protein